MSTSPFAKRCPGCGQTQTYSCRDALVRARKKDSMCVPCSNRAAVPDVEDRFLEKVIPEPNSGCWLWLGALSSGRYGSFRLNGKTAMAHRVSYELFVGEIPDGLNVLHRCDTPQCVNPRHLWLGTQADNVEDMWEKDRAHDRRGQRAPMAKLSRDDVVEIKRRLGSESQTVLAEEFGVCSATISHIATGHTWSHVTA